MLILYISELCRTDVTDLVHINTKMALDFGKLFLALANDTIEYQKNLHVFLKKITFYDAFSNNAVSFLRSWAQCISRKAHLMV